METGEGAAEVEQGVVEVVAALVADGEAAEVVEPRVRSATQRRRPRRSKRSRPLRAMRTWMRRRWRYRRQEW